MTVLFFLYDLSIFILSLLYSPKYFWDMIRLKKYRKSFLSRMGFTFPKFDLKDKPVIWIHAASLGEAKASYSICKNLKTTYPDHILVFSHITETGFEEVSKNNPFIDHQFYLPLDYSFFMKKIVKRVNPKLFVVVESEFWINLFSQVKKHGAKIALINGRVSERSFQRFKKYPALLRHFFSPIDQLCVQNHTYENRFLSLNVNKEKISVTGNIKFDNPNTSMDKKSLQGFKHTLGLLPQHKVITIGSSHPGEEELLLRSLNKLLVKDRNLKIILVPRHPERFSEVELLLHKLSFHFVKYSNITQNDRFEKVILLDRMGMLNQCYQISDIAIVGGSFVKVGGHNLVEPVQFSVPTFYGPHTFNQFELSRLLKEYTVGFETSAQTLSSQIQSYLYNEENQKNYQEKAKTFISTFKGSSKATTLKLVDLLNSA